MNWTETSLSEGARAPVTSPVDPMMEAALRPPPQRDDWMGRERLLTRMQSAVGRPVTLVAAPAGYGKTTLVAQWLASRHEPAVAWVSLDAGDSDPHRLWTHVAAALERAGCVIPPPSRALTTNAPGPVLPSILQALAARVDDIVVVLDDFHCVRDAVGHDQVEFLVENLPRLAHLVIVSRADPGLRLGRLRASGGLAEIRADALAFTAAEATQLLAQVQVQLSDDALAQLMQRTEGWPAGLHLATLSLAGQPDPEAFVRRFSGSNRFVVDYLTEEVLNRHSDEVRDFIGSVSILDRFSASLCDHVAGSRNAATVLRDLERTNLFLVPLDEERRWYRFHHLFAAVARSDMETASPDRARRLHMRAASWFRDHGYIDEAVVHSLAAGQPDEAGRLIQAHWLQFVDAGRVTTVLGWLQAMGAPSADSDPAANVTAAWIAALIGDEAGLAKSVAALDARRDHGPLPDGTRSVESALSMIQGVFGYGGPVEMLEGGRRAAALETDVQSPFYAVANMTLGHAAYVAGDLDHAVTRLAMAVRADAAPTVVRVLSLATASLAEAERGDVERSSACARQAMRLIEERDLQSMPQVSLGYTAMGLALAAEGKTDEAMSTLEWGLELRWGTSAHGPWGMIHHLIATARVAAAAGRTSLARDLLGELALRTQRFHDGMGPTLARVAAVTRVLQAGASDDRLLDPLTSRELDVLRMLQGSLSLHQVADELYLSFNTVKTHTRAVYRKLGAHSRPDAVRRARAKRLI